MLTRLMKNFQNRYISMEFDIFYEIFFMKLRCNCCLILIGEEKYLLHPVNIPW